MNNQNLVFVSQSGVAEGAVVESMERFDINLFGLAYVYCIPPSHEEDDISFSSPQICGGEWWKGKDESINQFARRVLAIDFGNEGYDPEKEYGVQYWLIGFNDPTNPNEEPTLLFKVWEGKYKD
jgi:hypothetical protein